VLDCNWRLNILYRWCHDIGREHDANKSLLKTVFQVLYSHVISSQHFLVGVWWPSGYCTIRRSWCVCSVPVNQPCCLLYVIKQRSALSKLILNVHVYKYFGSFIRMLYYFILIFVVFMSFHVDPTWTFEACFKGRYSKGCLLFLQSDVCPILFIIFIQYFLEIVYSADMGCSAQAPAPQEYSF
jgi:hypothetical protein